MCGLLSPAQCEITSRGNEVMVDYIETKKLTMYGWIHVRYTIPLQLQKMLR